jgi:hypothetical protein
MRKIKIVGLALAAVCALSAFMATSSFAAGQVLLAGNKIEAVTPFEVTPAAGTELLLEDMKATGPPTIHCSGIFDGHFEVGGELGFITEILTLAGAAAGNLVECTDSKSICSAPVDVTAINLPWDVTIELMAAGAEEYLILLNAEGTKIPGYTVDCNSLLGLVEDTCTGATAAVATTGTSGVTAEFSENETTTPPGSCSVGGTKQGLLAGKGSVTSTLGALTLSE